MSKDKTHQDHIRYDILVQQALRGVVKKVLREIEKTGLPGEHHFFISFVTTAPGVRISERLLKQYENEMTIVLQNQYWDFKVSDDGFEVGLSFDGQNEKLEIPFSALKGFFDPAVQFGLQFDVAGASENEENKDETKNIDNIEPINQKKKEKIKKKKTPKKTKPISNLSKAKKDKNKDNADDSASDTKVISLDSFRKKD